MMVARSVIWASSKPSKFINVKYDGTFKRIRGADGVYTHVHRYTLDSVLHRAPRGKRTSDSGKRTNPNAVRQISLRKHATGERLVARLLATLKSTRHERTRLSLPKMPLINSTLCVACVKGVVHGMLICPVSCGVRHFAIKKKV